MKKLQIFLGLIAGVLVNYYYNYSYSQKIEKVVINGCKNFSAHALQKIVQEKLKDSYIPLEKIKYSIEEIDFVENCQVKNIFPNIILLNIKEKIPLVKNIKDSIIATDLSVINTKPLFKINLLKIAGNGYDEEIIELLDLLKQYKLEPDLCIFIRPGRWNLIYKNKLIKLPAYNIEKGIETIIKYKNHSWFEYATEIDLRKKGHAIIQSNTANYQDWVEKLL